MSRQHYGGTGNFAFFVNFPVSGFGALMFFLLAFLIIILYNIINII